VDLVKRRARFVLLACISCFGGGLLGSADPAAVAVEPRAVWVWGSNRSGQLGRATQNFHVPSMLDGLGDVTALAGGGSCRRP
jgi:hypothetical protein